MLKSKVNSSYSNKANLEEFEVVFGLNIKNAKFSKTGKYLIFLNSEVISRQFFLQEALIIYDIENSQEKSRINLKTGSIVKDYICIDDGDTNYVLVFFSTSIHLWNIDTGASCGSLDLNAVGDLSVDIRDFIISNDSTYVGYLATDEVSRRRNEDF